MTKNSQSKATMLGPVYKLSTCMQMGLNEANRKEATEREHLWSLPKYPLVDDEI